VTKLGIVDYWIIHRLIDALRHMKTMDKDEMHHALNSVWDYMNHDG